MQRSCVFRTEVKRVWRDVIGYEGIYKVSNLGEVYSVRNKSLLECVRGKYVNLSRDGRAERLKVAYLVARLFIRNEELRPYVIHLNGDRSDNRASNLSWSELSEEDSRGRREQKCSRAVLCYSEDGEFIGRYVSIGDAAIKVGVSKPGILRVCQGKGKRCGGYIWRYE